MSETRTLRRDARDNVARIRSAALEIFLSKGLGAPLDEIARSAGVSAGTLYNRFGSREGLIDAVVPEVAGARLHELGQRVAAGTSTRARLETFVHGMIDLQVHDPALNDAILRRFPGAVALVDVCDRAGELGTRLVDEAHADGSLVPEFTADDLLALLWLAGTASREPAAPGSWRRVVDRALASAWATRARV